MITNELIDALALAYLDHKAHGRGEGAVWIEDDNGYRRIERVYSADGGIYIKTISEVPVAKPQADDLREAAWGLIANAGGGDWHRETSEWREAAERFRDRYINKVPTQ